LNFKCIGGFSKVGDFMKSPKRSPISQ
jgi:hypothetical protein